MNKRVLFVYPNLQLMQMVPPGVLSLASYIKSKGHIVDLFDTTFYQMIPRSLDEMRVDYCQVRPFDLFSMGVQYKGDVNKMLQDFYNKVETFKPDILAISVNDLTQNIARLLLKGFKQKYPNIFVQMGGIFTTFFSDYAIQLEDVDAICIGEGWGALSDLCDNLGTDNVRSIQNLWVKENDVIYKNAIRPPMNLEELPLEDYSLFDEKRYFRPMQGKIHRMCPIWIDMGCPFQCTYCIAPRLCSMYKEQGFKYFRTKSVDRIMREIDNTIEKINPNYLYFSTETFFARPQEHIEEFARRYAEKYAIPFWCESRIETINRKNIQLLKQMNCDRISVGLESGNEYYRRNILKKGFTNKMFLEKLELLNEFKLNVTINNIIGLPDETRDMIVDTIMMNREVHELCKNIDITMSISTYIPCGGQSLREYALERGYFNEGEYLNLPLGEGFHHGVFLNMPQITPNEVRGLLRTFPLYVKMPEKYFSRIRQAEKLTEQGDKVFEKLKTIFWEKYFK